MSTYFVSQSGSDSSPTGSISAPWRTISYGAGRLFPGDTLLVRGGNYGEVITHVPSGTSWDNKIRIANYDDETVWLNPNFDMNCVRFDVGQHYIEFDGINMYAPHNGAVISLDETTHHCRFQNLEVYNPHMFGGTGSIKMGWHGSTGSTNHHLLNVTVHGPGGTYAVYILGRNNLVERCHFYETAMGFVHIYNGGATPSGNIIRNNVCHDITISTFFNEFDDRTFGILIGGDDNQVYNNLFYGLALPGVAGFQAGISQFTGRRNRIFNNVVANCPATGGIYITEFSHDTQVRNNICYNNGLSGFMGDDGTGTSMSGNIGSGGGAGWSNVNPQFVSLGGNDFHLQGTSPAIDAGDNAALAIVTTDLDGGSRPFGATIDIGAYEYGAEPSTEFPPPVYESPGEIGTGASPVGGSPTGSPQPGSAVGVSIITDFYSDHDMQCPASWYGGFKEGRVQRFGDGERSFSNLFTGDWQGSTFTLSISDFDRKLRHQLASAAHRFWTEPLTIRMTTRANRAVLGTPYTVFVGPIIDIRPDRDLMMNLTLGDIVSQVMLSDDHQIPWRSIRDSFINTEMEALSSALDLDQPEPTIYGQHRRIPDVDPASPQGFQYSPTYLGLELVGFGGSPEGDDMEVHSWLIAGHACKALPDVLVWDHDEEGGLLSSNSLLADPDWIIPGVGGVPLYEDRRSSTYGNLRRYCILRARSDNQDALDIVAGIKTLAVFVDGVETVGDGTGELITDRIQQYKHFLINYVVNHGPNSYQSGDWLTNPTWDLFDGPVSIVEEASFDACSAIGVERMPLPVGISPAPDYAAGYIGAAIIGARASDRSSVRRWLSDWNRSCGVFFGITHIGQIRVSMLHPTAAVKAAAPLYTDGYEILEDSFGVDYQWGEKANRIPWQADYEHTSGQWKTAGVLSIETSIDLYGREISGELRQFPFAPGETAANHLALMEAKMRLYPPMRVLLEATIGPNPVTGESLGYLDLGSYIRYQHYSAIAEPAARIRLGYVVRHQVQAGKRRVMVELLDCEELMDFDAPIVYDAASFVNDTCATAITITPSEITNYTTYLNTGEHATDPSVNTSVLDGAPAAAHHAAWFRYQPPLAQYGHVTTGLSSYDTVLAVYRGACGALDLVTSNDNDTGFNTSFIEFAGSLFLDPAYEYFFLVIGFNPIDSGNLVFTLYTEPLS